MPYIVKDIISSIILITIFFIIYLFWDKKTDSEILEDKKIYCIDTTNNNYLNMDYVFIYGKNIYGRVLNSRNQPLACHNVDYLNGFYKVEIKKDIFLTDMYYTKTVNIKLNSKVEKVDYFELVNKIQKDIKI